MPSSHSSSYKFEFEVKRSFSRVTKNLRRTEDWLPCLFSPGFEGKRIAGSNRRGVGAAFKASYFEITTSFAKDQTEKFTVTYWSNGFLGDEDDRAADDGTLATEITSFSTITANVQDLNDPEYNGGHITIYWESQAPHKAGNFHLYWFPIPDGRHGDDPLRTKRTQFVLVYPNQISKYGFFGKLGGQFTQAYQHRVDSADDLRQMLSS